MNSTHCQGPTYCPACSSDGFVEWCGRIAQRMAGPPPLCYHGAPLDEDAVEAALIDAWVRGSQDPAYFKSFVHLLRYVLRGAHWHTIREYRRRSKLRPLPPEPDDERCLAAPGEGGMAPLVWHCWHMLPLSEQRLLEGHFYLRLSDVEQGILLYGAGTAPASALGQRVFRQRRSAQKHLRSILEAETVYTTLNV
jgi:hypothetical protein